MRIFLTGATGFLGRPLVQRLAEGGHPCTVLSRGDADPWRHPHVRLLRGDPTRPGEWLREVTRADAVINLAGAPIVRPLERWTADRKRRLRESRILTTRQLAAALRDAPPADRVLVSGSAIGYYGPQNDTELDEAAPAGADFLAGLAREWEREALAAADVARVVLVRTGLVLHPKGGLLAPLLPLFRLGLGGPWGDGRGWLSWIHLHDWLGLVEHALARDLAGPLNATAPHPVRVHEFARILGEVLKRPAWLRVPAFALRLAMGEAADALLHLQRVIPRRALESGYAFRFPELEPALRDLLSRT